MPDASRAVGVASALVDPEQRAALSAQVKAEYREIAERRASGRAASRRVSLEQARENRLRIDWDAYVPAGAAAARACRSFDDYDLAELAPYIDWTPFFRTWELKGTFPKILDDPTVGDDGARRSTTTRRRCSSGSSPSAGSRRRRWSGCGRPPPTATTSASTPTRSASAPLATLHTLRQQLARDREHPNLALADFVAPLGAGVEDYIGAFAVTTGHGERERAEAFERDNDDYNGILFTALCDRLAEAFAERMHERVRRELWGYAAGEQLSTRGADRRALPRHPPGARATAASPTTPRSARSSRCSTPPPTPGSSSPRALR